ncbi:methyltransferase [Lujinxingia vulgaris]|uniref:Methyltransferase n=2 Tax=Lujinxingia vulgaris TaxID=2600176 RepID=A0A5C6XTC6_9DELT|nr:methyltransferase [Lujinxingia vulgaris]
MRRPAPDPRGAKVCVMARKKRDIRNVEPTFKGWAVPGPLPDVARMMDFEAGEGESLDALSGHFRIFQLKKGHRFSTDDVLTAWYGSSWCPSAGAVLDLGSGVGSVGMTAAWRLRGARFVTVEAQEESVALARRSTAYNGLEDRYEIRQGDFRDPEVLAEDERFDLVLGSPPYWPLSDGTQGDHPQKVACRFEVRGSVADYAEVAAAHLNPGGVFACVFPVDRPQQKVRPWEAAENADMTIVRWRPVIFREGNPPLIGLFVMMRNADLPEAVRGQTWEEPPLIIRDAAGEVHPEYRAVKMSFGFSPLG